MAVAIVFRFMGQLGLTGMQWKNGVIGGIGMALIGGVIDGPQYAAVMGVAGFVAALFWFKPVKRSETAAAVEPPRAADK